MIRPQLLRLNADILCLQEVNGQEEVGSPRRLLALDTPVIPLTRVFTGSLYDRRRVTGLR
ncbi:MAG: hypothetical protein PHG79_11420 [Methanosarcina sp.]|nr:hypothetical protein [Methanosarcina sp.]MDD4523777.1 hypothetical protein [Methanosarcina sp.]